VTIVTFEELSGRPTLPPVSIPQYSPDQQKTIPAMNASSSVGHFGSGAVSRETQSNASHLLRGI
jgi:hypothetical protein